MKITYILFDAGGTLIFPDFEFLALFLKEEGVKVSPNDLFQAFAYADFCFDERLRKSENTSDTNIFLKDMLSRFFEREEQKMDKIVQKILEEDRKHGLWRHTFDWVKEALKELSKKYGISVISNSDGRVEELLTEASLRSYFEKIYDSQIVGIEKPDKGIYELALKELDLSAENVVFVGDIFHVDILGANRAGIPAVHLDPFGFYKKWPGARISTVAQLKGFLESGEGNFFPFGRQP